jgi:carbonic anhydrase/acetyltransferase-like protein (isoleucine patch superfamily)
VVARLLRPVRRALQRARFRAWALRTDLELRRRGGRLVLDAPWGAELDGRPVVRVLPEGAGDGTLTLRIRQGVRIGRWVTIEVWARGTNVIELGDFTHVGDGARIELHSGRVRAADHVQIRGFTLLKSAADLVIGSRAVVSHGAAVHCAERVELAERSLLANRALVVDSDHVLDGSDEYFYDRPVRTGAVVVGPNTFVAANAVIARGARLGRNSAVGAGSVVRAGEYPDGWLIAGTPARPVRQLSRAEAAQQAGT